MQRCGACDALGRHTSILQQPSQRRVPLCCPRGAPQLQLRPMQQHLHRPGRLFVLSSKNAAPEIEQRPPQQAGSGRRLLNFGSGRSGTAASPRERAENNIAPLPRGRRWRKQTDQTSESQSPDTAATPRLKRKAAAGPLTDFATAVDPKPKAGSQQEQQPGGGSNKRQLAAALKTSAQKLAAQQPAERASGPQVGAGIMSL